MHSYHAASSDYLLVVGVNDALRLAAWLTAGGGGGIVGGVDLGWVFTSAGESGIVPTVASVLPTKECVSNDQNSNLSTCTPLRTHKHKPQPHRQLNEIQSADAQITGYSINYIQHEKYA